MLIVRGDYIWTGDELLTDAAVLCADGHIQSIGDYAQLQAANPHATVVGGAGMMVLPGLINAHHHGNGITSFMRGVHDDALEPWLASLGSAPPVDPYLDTLWCAIGVLEAGYTTLVLFQSTANPATALDEAKARIRACRDVGLRIAFGLDLMQQNFHVYGPEPAGLPPRNGLTTQAYLQLLQELTREFASDPEVAIFAAPSGPQWVTDEAWEAIGAWSLQHGVPLHTHCLESPYEAEFALRAYDGSVVRHLDKLGALHRHTALVHGVYLTSQELDLMSEKKTSLITNPGSNLRLRCGVSPVLNALKRGVNVALGTDGCTLGERDDAFAEMRLLFYLQRGPGIPTPALTWEHALKAATQGAAAVTPWSQNVGAIRPGALADLSVFNLQAASAPWSHPDLDPRHILVHRASREHLAATIVGGQLVYDAERGPLRVKAADVAEKLHESLANAPLRSKDGITNTVRAYFQDWPIPKIS